MSKQTEDIAAIKQLAKDWRAGWLSGDHETLLALLSDEPVLIMSSEDPIIGKEAIRELYQSRIIQIRETDFYECAVLVTNFGPKSPFGAFTR